MRNELKIPKGLFFSIPNEMHFNVGTGLVPGFPDLGWLVNNTVVFFETKTSVGRLSPKQKLVHKHLRAAGYEVHVVRELEIFKSIVSLTLNRRTK